MRTCIAILLVGVATARALAGQWSVAPEVGLVAFAGTSRDSAGVRIGPTRSTVIGLRFGRETARGGVSLRILTGSTGFGATDGDLTVIQEHQLRLLEVAGVVSWRLRRIGVASGLGLELGPVLDVWMPQGATSHSRIGGEAALSWAFAVTPRLDAALRLEGAVTGSMLDSNDLPASAERKATWRRGVGLALRWHGAGTGY